MKFSRFATSNHFVVPFLRPAFLSKCSLFSPPQLCLSRRFASRASTSRGEFIEATRDIPRTPSGANPYDVFEVVPTTKTTTEELSKKFKKLAVHAHPDREGGSHEKMSELNAAFTIIKEHHVTVIKNLQTVAKESSATRAYAQHRAEGREEEVGRRGGLRSNVHTMNKQKARTPGEIANQWEKIRTERQKEVARIVGRYEVACEQGIFFKKANALNEITVRERWLRKQFIKNLWEEVHELRTELLRRGARNLQMSQVAEEMVNFANQVQKKLDEDFINQAQQMFQAQLRFHSKRAFFLIVSFTTFLTVVFKVVSGVWPSTARTEMLQKAIPAV